MCFCLYLKCFTHIGKYPGGLGVLGGAPTPPLERIKSRSKSSSKCSSKGSSKSNSGRRSAVASEAAAEAAA